MKTKPITSTARRSAANSLARHLSGPVYGAAELVAVSQVAAELAQTDTVVPGLLSQLSEHGIAAVAADQRDACVLPCDSALLNLLEMVGREFSLDTLARLELFRRQLAVAAMTSKQVSLNDALGELLTTVKPAHAAELPPVKLAVARAVVDQVDAISKRMRAYSRHVGTDFTLETGMGEDLFPA